MNKKAILIAGALALVGSRVHARELSVADLQSQAGNALVAGDYQRALKLADQGLRVEPGAAFLLYDRGCALAGLGEPDQARVSLDAAAARFAALRMPHWQALSAFRAGIAFEQAGRCEEAQAS